MAKTIPSEFPAIANAEFLILEDIDRDDWLALLRGLNREFSERGSRVPGMWPINGEFGAEYFRTSSITPTSLNSASSYHWDLWSPIFSLQKDLNNAGSEVLIIEYEAYIRDIEVVLTFEPEDKDEPGLALGTITINSNTGATELVTGSLSIAAADGDFEGVAGNEPRSIICHATGEALDPNGTVWLDHVHEYRLTTTDGAKLPIGY